MPLDAAAAIRSEPVKTMSFFFYPRLTHDDSGPWFMTWRGTGSLPADGQSHVNVHHLLRTLSFRGADRIFFRRWVFWRKDKKVG